MADVDSSSTESKVKQAGKQANASDRANFPYGRSYEFLFWIIRFIAESR